MKMYLLFTVCLISNPDDCQNRDMLILEPITPMACVMNAPSELARWREMHPKWRIARWRCAPDVDIHA